MMSSIVVVNTNLFICWMPCKNICQSCKKCIIFFGKCALLTLKPGWKVCQLDKRTLACIIFAKVSNQNHDILISSILVDYITLCVWNLPDITFNLISISSTKIPINERFCSHKISLSYKIDFDNLLLLKWFPLLRCKSFPFLTQIMFTLAPSALVRPEWITSFNFSVWTLAVTRRYGPVCPNINTSFHSLFTFTTTQTLWLVSRNFPQN